MSNKVSVLIGSVVEGTPKLNRTIKGERFYTVKVSFNSTVIPVLYSQYVNDKEFEKDTKLKVTGCLMSDIADGKLPVFYIYANSIEVESIDCEECNLLNFSCTVTKVRDFKTNNNCTDILPLVASDGSPLCTTSILYLCAKHSTARKLRNKKKGYTISGNGYLKQYRDIYEIYIKDVDNLDEICK